MCIGSHIEGFVPADPHERTTGDISNRVAASFPRGNSNRGQSAHDGRRIFNVNKVQLKILACGYVGNAVRILLGQFGHHLKLLWRHPPVGNLYALHARGVPDRIGAFGDPFGIGKLFGLLSVMALAVVVTLSVNPTTQPRFGKHFFVDLVLSPQLDFGLEGINLFSKLHRYFTGQTGLPELITGLHRDYFPVDLSSPNGSKGVSKNNFPAVCRKAVFRRPQHPVVTLALLTANSRDTMHGTAQSTRIKPPQQLLYSYALCQIATVSACTTR